MVSFKTTLLILASAIAVSADYYINPSSVPLATRDAWCASEVSTCPLICLQNPPGSTEINTCDATTLTYGCLCGNGQQPNVSEYSLTLPYFVCQEWGVQCVAACGNDASCQSDCTQNHPCGAQSPPRANTTTTSSTLSATAAPSSTTSGGQVFNGLGSTSTASAGGSGGTSAAPPALEFGRAYGMLVVLGSLFAGFALML